MIKFEVGDLVTVKLTSPKYKWYKNKVGTVQEILAQFVGASEDDVIVNFDGLECAFKKNELKKV